jgi:hypothetical protein
MNSDPEDTEYAGNLRDMTVTQVEERRHSQHEMLSRATGLPLGQVKRLASEHRLSELYDADGQVVRVPTTPEARQAWLVAHRFTPAPSGDDTQAAQGWLEHRRHPPTPPASDVSACRAWLAENQ